MSCLEKGVSYDELPDLYLIFITEKDFFAHKLGIYYVERRLKNIGNTVDNGIHEIYANLECECGNEKINELIRRLLKDGRNEDMVKSLEEPEYQEQLLKEYNL